MLSETVVFTVPGIHCAHCAMSIREEVSEVDGVEDVAVDLDTKLVTIRGRPLDDAALRAAIAEAGYEAA
jgi:copper chaperone